MLLCLVKKEYLIVKKYVWMVAAISAFIPLFFIWRMPEHAGMLGYILSCIFSVFLLLQYVSQKECMFPKAPLLLCAAPYSRKLLVTAKYIFFFCVFAVCTAVFWVETLFLPQLGGFNTDNAVLMLFVFTVFMGIYLPLQYRLGFEKTKLILMVVIMLSPIAVAWLAERNAGITLMKLFSSSSRTIMYGTVTGISCAVYGLSALVSVWIYEKADIA